MMRGGVMCRAELLMPQKAAGADVSYIDERKFKEMNIKGEALKSWPLYTEVFEADKVINIPIAKHHGLAKLTMSMKNWMGVMGGSRRTIHQRLDESLVDLSMAIKPTLTILDAVRILTANGPQGGNLDDVKKWIQLLLELIRLLLTRLAPRFLA